MKKAKLIEDKYLLDYQYQVLLAQYQRQSAYHSFRPWTAPSAAAAAVAATTIPAKHLPHLPYPVPAAALPYLSQEPPILQNPERVVRLTECERYEQSYQPNVALAPRNGNGLSVSSSQTHRQSIHLPDKKNRVHWWTFSSALQIVPVKSISLSAGKTEPLNRDYEDGNRDAKDHPIPIDVKIKEERPQTPSDESQSHSPEESCITSGGHSIVKLVQKNGDTNGANVPPISPEGQSASSNEITSSTSPVPTAFDKLNDSMNHASNTGETNVTIELKFSLGTANDEL